MLEDDGADNQRGIVSTNSINWDKFKQFDRKKVFLSTRIKASKLLNSYLRNVSLSYRKLTIR